MTGSTLPDPADPYGVDVLLGPDGDLVVHARGGLQHVQGAANVQQALLLRVRTYPGELPMHDSYGSFLALKAIGRKAGDDELAQALARQELQAILDTDRRMLEARDVTAATDPHHPTRLRVGATLVLGAGEQLEVLDLERGETDDAAVITDVDLDELDPDETLGDDEDADLGFDDIEAGVDDELLDLDDV